MNAAGVLENFVDDYTYMTRVCDFGILTYTFHPHVIGRGHRMMMLERLIQRLMRGRRGVRDHGRRDAGMAGAPPARSQGRRGVI